MNKPWTEQEEQILKERYITEPVKSLAAYFKRSVEAIRSKAYKLDLIRERDDASIPQGRMLKVFDLIKLLQSENHTIESLAKKIDSSERTVYRYFKLIEVIGFELEESFDGKFFIITDNCKCPLCGNKNEENIKH